MPDDMPNLPVPSNALAAGPPAPADLAAVAERIRGRERAVRDGALAYLHNGADLSAMKRRLGHGAFMPWCEREFKDALGWSVRTIERMILAADAVGDKIDTLSNLKVPKTTVYAVTAPSTPEPIRRDFLARLDAGDHSASQTALSAIKAAKDEAYRAARRERQTPEARAAADKREISARKRQERQLAERDAEEAARKAALSKAVAMLRDRLGEDVEQVAALFEQAGYGVMRLASILRETESMATGPHIDTDEGTALDAGDETVAPDVVPVVSPRAAVPRRGSASVARYGEFKRPAASAG